MTLVFSPPPVSGHEASGATTEISSEETITKVVMDWQVLSRQFGLPSTQVTALAYDPAGFRAWIGSGQGRLSRYSNGLITQVELPDHVEINRINALAFQAENSLEGRLWMGTPVGLFCLSGGSWRQYLAEDGLPGNEITCLLVEGERLYAGTLDGLAVRAGPSFKILTEDDGLPSDHITALAFEGESLWIGTDGGLASLRGEKIEAWEEKDGLLNQWITTLAVETYPDRADNEPRLWIGTTLGLCCFEPATAYDPWHYYTEEEGLAGNWITALAVEANAAEQRRLWVASQAGGLDRIMRNPGPLPDVLELVNYNRQNISVPLDRITCLVSCRPRWPYSGSDVLLAGTASSGAIRVYMSYLRSADAEADPFIHSNKPLKLMLHHQPYHIREMVCWRAWLVVGTDHGLVFLNSGNRVEPLTLWDGGFVNVKAFGQFYFGGENFPVPSLNLKVNDLLVDNQDTLWVATEQNGILSFDGAQWRLYTVKSHGLTGNSVSALASNIHDSGVYAAYTTRTRRLPQRIDWFDGTRWQRLDRVFEQFRQRETVAEGPARTGILSPSLPSFSQLDSAPYTPKKITAIAARPDGIFFAAVHGLGLCSFDGTAWKLYRSEAEGSGLISNFIKELYLDRHNDLWIVTMRGLSRLTAEGKWLRYMCPGWIYYNRIQDLAFDDRFGFQIYIFIYLADITTGALFRTSLEKENWIRIRHVEHGLLCLAIGKNYLWLGTQKGLLRLDK